MAPKGGMGLARTTVEHKLVHALSRCDLRLGSCPVELRRRTSILCYSKREELTCQYHRYLNITLGYLFTMPERLDSLAITSELIRAARALLRWEQRDLARASGVSLPTIQRREDSPVTLQDHRTTGTGRTSALEAAGIQFTNGSGPGVRLKRPDAAKIQRPGGHRSSPEKRRPPRKDSR